MCANAMYANKCLFRTTSAFAHETQISALHAEIRYLSTMFRVAMVAYAEIVAQEGRCADGVVLDD